MAVRLHPRVGQVAEADRLEASPDAVLVSEPTIGAMARTKGALFVLVTARGGGSRGREATRLVGELIRDSYYYDESAGIPVCLAKSIRGANRRMAHRREIHALGEGALSIAIAVVRDRELYVVTAGDADAYLVRDGGMLTLPEAERGPALPTTDDPRIDVWRGEFAVGDGLLLAARAYSATLGAEEMRRSVAALPAREAAEHLHHQLVAAGAGASDGILVLEASEVPATHVEHRLVPVKAAEPLAGAPERSPIPLADSVAGGVSAVEGRVRDAGSALGSTVGGAFDQALDLLPRRRAAMRRVTPLAARREVERRTGTLVLGLLAVVLLAGMAAWLAGGGLAGNGKAISSANAGESALTTIQSDVQQVFGGGLDLVAADPGKALDLLRSAWGQFGAAEQSGIAPSVLQPLEAQVVGGLDRLYAVVPTDASTIGVLTRLSPHANLSGLVQGPDGAAYTIDRSTHSVIRIDLTRRTAEVIVKQGDGPGNGVGDPWMLAVGGPDLLIVDHNGAVWRWRPADKLGHGTLSAVHVGGNVTWGNDITAVATYLRNPATGLYNLYVVDPAEQQILRYAPAADGSGYPTNPTGYLATASDVSQYEQIFIDGDIYALASNTVTRLVGGRPDSFALATPPDDGDLRPGHDYRLMTASSTWRQGRLYVWDAKWGRVIAFDKATGAYIEQYVPVATAAKFTDVRGMFLLDRGAGRAPGLVWASANRIYLTILEAASVPGPVGVPVPVGATSPPSTAPAGSAAP